MKYMFLGDPGHGWLRVPKDELVKLGIHNDISSYSYERGRWAYLEEDCDYSRFAAAKRAVGEAFRIDERYTDKSSPVRRYSRYGETTESVERDNKIIMEMNKRSREMAKARGVK